MSFRPKRSASSIARGSTLDIPGKWRVSGDFFATQLGDLPVVIVRDAAGALRAFANVCRHRGSEVVLECAGNRKTLQCHYHGWTYNLDGTLRTAPRENEQRGLREGDALSLVPFAVETWGPLIFVNPAPGASPLRDVIGELPAIFERAGIDLRPHADASPRHLRTRRRTGKSSSKISTSAITARSRIRSFHEVIDTDSYRVDTDHEYYSTYYGPLLTLAEPRRHVRDPVADPDVLAFRQSVEHAGDLPPFPSTRVTYSPDSSTTISPTDLSDQQMRDYVEFSDLVTREDVVLCESVQRGMRSGAIEHGHLMLSRERGIQHFQKLVYRFLSAE